MPRRTLNGWGADGRVSYAGVPQVAPPGVALQLGHVTKTFTRPGRPSVTAVRDASLAVPAGQMLAVVGESGSGKSTLMHCAAGLTDPTSGSVVLLGHDLARMSRPARTRFRARHVGFVFQDLNLVSSLTVAQNILLPGRIGGATTSEAELPAILDTVGLTPRRDHMPHELSGGEQQRVAIGRVLATRPGIVFADEPTSALDHTTSTALLRLLRTMTERGTTVVMVTHDLDAVEHADRAVVMAGGTLRADLPGPTREAVIAQLNRTRVGVR